jgi:peptide/nickel transport system substrate-binding protein
LNVAVAKDTESFDAMVIAFIRSDEMCANLYETPMWWPLVNGAFQYPQPAPYFVKSVQANANKTDFLFTIPTDHTFAGSGNPVTVDDVVWSLQRMGTTGLGGFYYGVVNVDPKNPVSKVSDTQFRIKTSAPSNFLLQVLSTESFSIYDSKVFKQHATSQDRWALNWAKTNAAGSGPYTLSNVQVGVGSTLTANPKYKGHMSVRNPGVNFSVVPSVSDRVSILEKGAVDIAQAIPKQRLKDLSAQPNIKIIRRRSTYQHYLVMDTQKGPFTDVRLRQAVNYALPYDKILADVFYGYAVRLTGPVPSGGFLHDPSLRYYNTDVSKATKLVQEATGGKSVTVDYYYDPVTVPENGPLATVVQAALGAVGINLTLHPTQPSVFAQQKYAKQYELFQDQIIFWVDDPAYGLEWYHTGDFYDYSAYSNPSVDKWLKEIGSSTNPAVRQQLAYELQQKVVDDAPYAWIAQADIAYAARSNVNGFAPHPTDMMYFGPMYIA